MKGRRRYRFLRQVALLLFVGAGLNVVLALAFALRGVDRGVVKEGEIVEVRRIFGSEEEWLWYSPQRGLGWRVQAREDGSRLSAQMLKSNVSPYVVAKGFDQEKNFRRMATSVEAGRLAESVDSNCVVAMSFGVPLSAIGAELPISSGPPGAFILKVPGYASSSIFHLYSVKPVTPDLPFVRPINASWTRDFVAIPRQIVWWGFVGNTLFWAMALWVVVALPKAVVSMLRKRRGTCRACGYPARGAVCSECGAMHIARV